MTKLVIDGIGQDFILNSASLSDGCLTLSSANLLEHISGLEGARDHLQKRLDALQPAKVEEPPAPPEAPEVTYVANPSNKYSIEQLEASKWTKQQMIDAGYLIPDEAPAKVEEPPAPPVDAVPAAPEDIITAEPEPEPLPGQFEVKGDMYVMTAKAAGATYEQFKKSNWTIDQLVTEGYAEFVKVPENKSAVPAAPEEPEWPRLNSEGDWEDSAGTIFNADQHSMSTNKTPAVTVKGIFKKTRKRKPTADEVPAAPADEAPAAPTGSNEVPAAPAAPEADTVSADEPLDDELAALVKDW